MGIRFWGGLWCLLFLYEINARDSFDKHQTAACIESDKNIPVIIGSNAFVILPLRVAIMFIIWTTTMWNLYDKTFFLSLSPSLSRTSLFHSFPLSVSPWQKITCIGHALPMMVHIFNLLHQQNNIAEDFFFFGSFFDIFFFSVDFRLRFPCRLSNFEFIVIFISFNFRPNYFN